MIKRATLKIKVKESLRNKYIIYSDKPYTEYVYFVLKPVLHTNNLGNYTYCTWGLNHILCADYKDEVKKELHRKLVTYSELLEPVSKLNEHQGYPSHVDICLKNIISYLKNKG